MYRIYFRDLKFVDSIGWFILWSSLPLVADFIKEKDCYLQLNWNQVTLIIT